MVAQVDKEQSAMVADPMNPAGEPDIRADIGFPQLNAGMAAVTMHLGSFDWLEFWRAAAGKRVAAALKFARKSACKADFVKVGGALARGRDSH
jgi:hypothetical protein